MFRASEHPAIFHAFNLLSGCSLGSFLSFSLLSTGRLSVTAVTSNCFLAKLGTTEEKASMSAPPLIRAPSPLPFLGGTSSPNTEGGGGEGGGGVISFQIQIGMSREPVLLDAAELNLSQVREVACSIINQKVTSSLSDAQRKLRI